MKHVIFETASKDVKEGESCNEDSNTSSAKWCASGLTCTTCGSESVKQCRKESKDGLLFLNFPTYVIKINSNLNRW